MAFDIGKTGLDQRVVHWHESIDSTMHEAVRLAQAGAPSGTIIGAEEQTAGQGRHGRGWHSLRGAGLYVSIILRAQVAGADLPVVTLALGLAAAEAITKTCGAACDLRWPNDVLISGRKCCGILTQLHGAAIVAGIGINVNHVEFPPELAVIATSMRIESGDRAQERETLLAHLVSGINSFMSILLEEGKESILRLFENASSYVRGRRVVVEDSIEGVTGGLNPNGFLILQRDDGTESLILAGGVRPAASRIA